MPPMIKHMLHRITQCSALRVMNSSPATRETLGFVDRYHCPCPCAASRSFRCSRSRVRSPPSRGHRYAGYQGLRHGFAAAGPVHLNDTYSPQQQRDPVWRPASASSPVFRTSAVVYRSAGAVVIGSICVLVLGRVNRAVESLLQADERDRDVGDKPIVHKQEPSQSCDLFGR